MHWGRSGTRREVRDGERGIVKLLPVDRVFFKNTISKLLDSTGNSTINFRLMRQPESTPALDLLVNPGCSPIQSTIAPYRVRFQPSLAAHQ